MKRHSSGAVRFFASGLAKFAFSILLFGYAALLAPAGRADNLHYFKNYFVTGDYTVAGVGLFGKGVNGTATGQINMTTVPNGADIVAAFLYVVTTETTAAPSTINGVFDGNRIVGLALGNPSTPSCWSQGGTAPNAFARVYRADVLRYLPVDAAHNIRIANGVHTVQFPDSGNPLMSVTPHTQGATLVAVYRILPVNGAASYKAVVIYDGAVTMSKFGPAFSQTLGGFYDAATTGAKMTHIVANGQPGTDVGLTVNGKIPAGVTPEIFDGSQGARWDNPTFPISLTKGEASVTSLVSPQNNQVCLTWGAILLSTDVENSDGDGILNSWKTNGLHLNIGNDTYPNPVAATFGGCADYPMEPCENFKAMGAVLGEKDVFTQVDWLEGNDGIGPGVHIHVPKLAALQMIYNVLLAHGIHMHFDVGTHYQGFPGIIPSRYAKGGNAIQESSLSCPNNLVPNPANCAFPNLPYSALSWKKGFDAIANGFKILGIPQYFPHDRKDSFYEVVFGHALAVASPANPQIPLSVSGVADTPGGDLYVSLGLWPGDDPPNCTQDDPTGTVPDNQLCINQTGTSLQQAGTMLHELGHNWGLYHGGDVKLPNCKPNYPSVMNYLYQTRGLTASDGSENIDFSYGVFANLDETALSETASPIASPIPPDALTPYKRYKIRYYTIPTGAESAGATSRGCNGTVNNPPEEVRLQAPDLNAPDWDNNGGLDLNPVRMDVNFDGTTGRGVFTDFDDWKRLNLQQIGGRLNVAGLSADISAPDLGQSDLGQSDLGQSDLGQSDLGQSDLGQSDLGQSDLGQSDLGDINYDTVISTLDATGPVNAPQGDPNGVLVAAASASSNTGDNEIITNWGLPGVGQIRTYDIHRINLTAPAGSGNAAPELVGTLSNVGAPPATTFTDVVNDFSLADSGANCPPAKTCYNATYEYYVIAKDINGTQSTPSNFATATVYHVFVTPVTANVVYGNPIPDLTSANLNIITAIGPAAGLLKPGAFSCTWTSYPNQPRNVGPYTTSCSGGPATLTDGAGNVYGVTYNADTTGTLTITPRPITVTANTNTRVYDGTNSASAPPSVTSALNPAVVAGDTPNFIEAYPGRNVGNGLTLTPFGSVSDGNSGNNYTVTFVNSNTGVITARPITVTANPATKVYDGTTMTVPTVPPSITSNLNPAIAPGDTATFIELYSSQNVGPGLTLVPSGSVSDGNNGANYAVNRVAVAGTINPFMLTVTAMGVNKVYDGTTTATVTFTDNRLAVVSDTFTYTYTANFASPNVGTGIAVTVTGISLTGGGTGNYSISNNLTLNTTANITPAPLTVFVTGAPGSNTVGSYSGFVNNETSTSVVKGTLSCAALPPDPAPTPNTPISCSGLAASNYAISYSYSYSTENLLGDSTAPLTVYVTGTETGANPAVFTATTYSGFINGDTPAKVTGTLSCSPPSGAASYQITSCSGLSAPIGYTIYYSPGMVTVGP